MKQLVPAVLLALALPAVADRVPVPTDTPASYKSECGSCHMAYQPALLAANDWRRTMASLKDHFATDATVDAVQAREIAAFLERHAGDPHQLGSAGTPPRITQSERFVRKHRKIAPGYWTDPRVKSAANCEACHGGAANGNYSEHDIAIRELRR